MNRTILAALAVVSSSASAFCGFYVAGGGAELFNNATQVVLMRDGTKTVLSMQNNYQGPPENFAMVIPVPVVLQKENVKTLARDVFVHIDQLAAPRLVEYWEQDPCAARFRADVETKKKGMLGMANFDLAKGGARALVTVEAQFTVGEYEIVILSAKDALGARAVAQGEQVQDPRWRRAAVPALRPAGHEVLRGPRRRQQGAVQGRHGRSSRRCASTTTARSSSCRCAWGSSTRRRSRT